LGQHGSLRFVKKDLPIKARGVHPHRGGGNFYRESDGVDSGEEREKKSMPESGDVIVPPKTKGVFNGGKKKDGCSA